MNNAKEKPIPIKCRLHFIATNFRFDIHLVTDEDIVVICVATNNASQKLVFAFLEDAEKEYKNNLIERGEQGARNAAAGVLDEKLVIIN
jgi:hypothetical protein